MSDIILPNQKSPLSAYEDAIHTAGGRAVRILSEPHPDGTKAVQQVTSPLLTVYTFADLEAVATLAAEAKGEAERAMQRPTMVVSESQPYLQAMLWTRDVARIQLSSGTDGVHSISVQREVVEETALVPEV